MMRSKEEARLDPWIATAASSKLAAFAAGVEADKDAVAAAISSPCSSSAQARATRGVAVIRHAVAPCDAVPSVDNRK